MLGRTLLAFQSFLGVGKGRKMLTSDAQTEIVAESDFPVESVREQSSLTKEGFGIETVGGVFTPLIPAGTKIPFAVTETFSTAADRQVEISLRLYRGTSTVARQNHFLDVFTIGGIRPARKGEPQVKVTFHISDQGQLQITAQDGQTKQPLAIRRMDE